MIKLMDIRDEAVAAQVLRVQIPAYQVEAALIGTNDIPPLKDTIHTLTQCGETFYGYFIGAELCGALSFKKEARTVDIHRMVVHPDHFRKGIAQALLHHLENETNPEHIEVSTGTKNTPAINFYEKNGFKEYKKLQLSEVLSLTFFHKHGNRPSM